MTYANQDELNQFAIRKLLGSKMTRVKQARFGNFGLLETTVEALRGRQAAVSGRSRQFSYEQDRLVVRAFEDVRRGSAPDAILWDRSLANAFVRKCHELGLQAPDAYLNRRLINIRKNIRRYEKHGISIRPATKTDVHPSIVPKYAHVIEFALVRLRYRYGASIDDILLDPDLGKQFVHLTSESAPGLRERDARLGALYIRKTRHFDKKSLARIDALDPQVIEKEWSKPVTLASIPVVKLPASPGLLELTEADRYLYISRNDDIRAAVEQMSAGEAFSLVANGFWSPRLDEVKLQYIVGPVVDGVQVDIWERRLIHDRQPIFNWPVQPQAA